MTDTTSARAEHLPRESQEYLGQKIREARIAKGWSREALSVAAEAALRARAADFLSPLYATTETRALWRTVEVSFDHVKAMERGPVMPLARGERRARLLGVCLALGLDRAELNEVAGGL